ncbi:MAG: response regulator transcription factor [Candidatus Sulfotelmatobacter sp.]
MTRILIADDSPPVRRGLRTLLGLNSDWEVCGEAVDGADAVEKAQQLAPDLILMDFSMPQMDGVQAAREIAKSGTDIPILLFTLNPSPQLMELARNAGLPGRDFKVGNQQVAICDHGASARRDLLLFDLSGGVSSAPEVG